ncbi:MAG: DGQHR domain-containing protein [Balneola sp.]
MAFIKQIEIEDLKSKLLTDPSMLGKLYQAKKRSYILKSIDHSLLDDHLKDGWEIDKTLKTKTRIRKSKILSTQFEDDIWVQLYKLGFRTLNASDDFRLPFGKEPHEKKQIDVVAIKDNTVLLVECKSSKEPKKAPSYKDDFELLGKRLYGFRKTFEQLLGKRGIKVKYIFATRNLRLSRDSADFKRLEETNSIYFSDKTYEYINNLIAKYKEAAFYQFYGMIFKGQRIDNEDLSVPAVQGKMGNVDYYLFSIEPEKLLRIGFILHRTRANEEETPTYQRLLVPSRLKGIKKFVNSGGYFPNSLIVNFSKTKLRLKFEPSGASPEGSNAKTGILKIPNAYAIGYIIDGQHRLYGYAGSNFSKTNSIPVVAFENLTASDQLKIFMDINENQKRVSPSLRLSLQEDLFWDSDRADSRLKALRSGIIRELGETQGPLFNKITLGEDRALLSSNFIDKALKQSKLLPEAKGNQYNEETLKYSTYNISNVDHNKEMHRTKRAIVDLVLSSFEYALEEYPKLYKKEKSLILSNRGVYAYISIIGSLCKELIDQDKLKSNDDPDVKFDKIKKYLKSLLKKLNNLSDEEELKLQTKYGTGGDILWLHTFQDLINKENSDYEPFELIDWKERQNEELQKEGRGYGVEIEKYIKDVVISNLKILYGNNWELEISDIKRQCQDRAEQERVRIYKELNKNKEIPWTDMFTVMHYKKIISNFWSKQPENNETFKRFDSIFAIDLGLGFNSKPDKLKWLSLFNSYRNTWAHEGTKESGLNKEEVETLKTIHKHLVIS